MMKTSFALSRKVSARDKSKGLELMISTPAVLLPKIRHWRFIETVRSKLFLKKRSVHRIGRPFRLSTTSMGAVL